MAVYAPRRRENPGATPHAVAMVTVSDEKQGGGISVVCEMKKDPAEMPGEGARAIDTFRKDYSAEIEEAQAANILRELQIEGEFSGYGYLEEVALMLSYLAGFKPEMGISVANKIASKVAAERIRA